MPKATMKAIAKQMKGIDFCMLTTTDARGTSTSRPMSNNGDVEYDGTSYFFTYANTNKIRAIKKNAKVSLQFINTSILKRNAFISVEAKAKLTTDRATMEKHWVPSLELWFPDGLDTRGITLISAEATHIHYWVGQEEGEFKPAAKASRRK